MKFTTLFDAGQETVDIVIDGRSVQVPKGISVAAAVLGSGLPYTRTTPVSGTRRAPFCMMGVCYECLMVIDGKANQRACVTLVRDNMRVEVQQGVGPGLPEIGHG